MGDPAVMGHREGDTGPPVRFVFVVDQWLGAAPADHTIRHEWKSK